MKRNTVSIENFTGLQLNQIELKTLIGGATIIPPNAGPGDTGDPTIPAFPPAPGFTYAPETEKTP